MGIIRLLLASIILSKHSQNILGNYLINPVFAVEIFFFISGFIIQKILSDKSFEFNLKKFYMARIKKIFPAYYFSFVCTVFIFIFSTLINGNLHKIFNEIHRAESYFDGINLVAVNFFILISNLFIFLQDIAMVLEAKGGDIGVEFENSNSDINFINLLIVPLAWSLATELYFYILAPFLLRVSNRVIIITALFFLIIKIYGYYVTENCNIFALSSCLFKDEYSYISFRLFPFVLFNFLMGAISYRFLLKLGNLVGKYTIYIGTFGIAFSLLCSNIFYSSIILSILILIIFFIFTPAIWLVFKNYKYDKFFSNISYPIYIFSFISIYSSSFIIKLTNYVSNEFYFFLALIIDLTVSFIYLTLFKYISSYYRFYLKSYN